MIETNTGAISVNPATYGLDCVILENIPTPVAELLDGDGRVRVRMNFTDMDYVTVWTKTVMFPPTMSVSNRGVVSPMPILSGVS